MQTTAVRTVANSLPENEVILLTLLISNRYISYIKMKSHTLKYQYFIYFQYPTACYTQHQNRDIISLNATSII